MNQPRNLQECFDWIDRLTYNLPIQSQITHCREDSLSQFHFSFGMYLRNTLKLWEDNSLTRYFNEMNIFHADDMSQIIIISYSRIKNNKPLDLDNQIKVYRDFWEKQGLFKREDFIK